MECAIGLQLHYVITYPNIVNYVLCVILSKKLDTFSCLNCATNQEVAITRLANASELQAMHHLIAKDKVPEQHI